MADPIHPTRRSESTVTQTVPNASDLLTREDFERRVASFRAWSLGRLKFWVGLGVTVTLFAAIVAATAGWVDLGISAMVVIVAAMTLFLFVAILNLRQQSRFGLACTRCRSTLVSFPPNLDIRSGRCLSCTHPAHDPNPVQIDPEDPFGARRVPLPLELQYDLRARYMLSGLTLFTMALVAWVNWKDGPPTTAQSWVLFLLWVLVFLPGLLEAWCVQITATDSGLLLHSPWRRHREIPWNRVCGPVRYNSWTRTYIFNTDGFGRVRVHQFLSGYPPLLRLVREAIRRNQEMQRGSPRGAP